MNTGISCFGYCECCCERGGTVVSLRYWFCNLWILRRGIARLYNCPVFSFWRTSTLFFIMAVLNYLLPNNIWGSFYPHPHQPSLYLISLIQLLWQVWGDISLWFWLVFLWWLVMLKIFSYICVPFECLLWKKCFCKSFAHF